MSCALPFSSCSAWLPWVRAEQREADLETRLGDQLALHQAQIKLLDRQIAEIGDKIRTVAATGKKDDARRLLKARKLMQTKRARYEQLVAVCQNTMDTITEGVNVRDTIGVLSELRGTFQRLDKANIFGQLEGAVDDLGALQSELSEAQLTMSASTGAQFDENELEAELEAELQALLAEDSDVATGAPVPQSFAATGTPVPPTPAVHTIPTEPEAIPAATPRVSNSVHQRYAAAGIALSE